MAAVSMPRGPTEAGQRCTVSEASRQLSTSNADGDKVSTRSRFVSHFAAAFERCSGPADGMTARTSPWHPIVAEAGSFWENWQVPGKLAAFPTITPEN
jgi:hypothetical protein